MNSQQPPRVTVIAGCYNHERFVEKCLESIRTQTYPNVQLIIMDDCSTDHSVAVIQGWIRKNSVECVFIPHSQNVGFPKTLNEALNYAEGIYVSIISTDDIWLPGFIEDRVDLLEAHDESYGLVYGKSLLLDEFDAPLPGFVSERPYFPEGFVLDELLKCNFVASNSVLLRRSCYAKVGKYDENLLIEDLDMWLRISAYYRFIYSPHALSKYRIVATSVGHLRKDELKSCKTRILLKQLQLSPEYLDLIEEKLIARAENIYQVGGSQASRFIARSLRGRFRKRMLLMFVFSVLKLPYSTFCRFDNSFRYLKGLIRVNAT